MRNLIIVLLGSIIGLILIYKFFFTYENHIDCEIKELQKLSYAPSSSDRTDIQLYCELKLPYEKKIYGPTVKEWNGSLIRVINDNEAYKVTKVKIYAQKESCDNPKSDLKPFTYYLTDGKSGGSLDWSEEYNCYLPNKTEFYGRIRKESFINK